jgi:hypothetical protein
MHAVAVEFDFMQPGVAVRRRVDQLRELRTDPWWERGRVGAPTARYGVRHSGSKKPLPGRRMRLLETTISATMVLPMPSLCCSSAQHGRRTSGSKQHDQCRSEQPDRVGWGCRHLVKRRTL